MPENVTPNQARRGLDDNARRTLADLEATRDPSAYAKGALAALRLSALDPDDRARTEALHQKWARR